MGFWPSWGNFSETDKLPEETIGEESTSIRALTAPGWVCPKGAAVAVLPQWQLCRTENGHGHSAQWAELKTEFTALANTTLDAARYIFTVSSVTWLFHLSLGKQAGKLKIPLYRATSCGNELRLLIGLCASLLWIPTVRVYSLMSLTGMLALPRLPPLLPGPLIQADVAIPLPSETCTSKGLHVSILLVTPAKSWPGCLAGGLVPACLKQTDCLGLLILSVARGGCLAAVDTFSGYGVAVPVCSANSSHNIVALETNLGHVFSFMGRLQSDMVCLLSQKAVHNGLTVKVVRQPSLLPAIYRDGLFMSEVSTPSPSPALGPYTWVRQFSHWSWLFRERNHLLWATSWPRLEQQHHNLKTYQQQRGTHP